MHGNYFLYAEDDAEDVAIFRDAVRDEAHPYQLVCVSDGFSLLQFLQGIQKDESFPCLIILDVQMPRLDGLATLELLRTDDMYRLIPVVIFSSRLSVSETRTCKQLGAEILEKPNTYAQWKNVFRRLLTYIDA
jgi:CheY-like chemotaxis protein